MEDWHGCARLTKYYGAGLLGHGKKKGWKEEREVADERVNINERVD